MDQPLSGHLYHKTHISGLQGSAPELVALNQKDIYVCALSLSMERDSICSRKSMLNYVVCF